MKGNIRALTPKGYDPELHLVIEFGMDNCKGTYRLSESDGFYHYTDSDSSETSVNYTEGALLACSSCTILSYIPRDKDLT